MTAPLDPRDQIVMPEPSSNGGQAAEQPRRDLRDRALFRVLALLAVLGAAFLTTKSCAGRGTVSQAEAIAIARKNVDFTPDQEAVRFLQRGLPPVGYWAVSLSTHKPDGTLERVVVVLVSEDTGRVSSP